MSAISSLTLTVCILSIASTLLLMLVPDKYRRELRMVTSLAAAVTVGAIVLGADFSELSAFPEMDSYTSSVTQDLLVQRELEDKISGYIAAFLEEEGIYPKKIEVGTTIDSSRSIFITKASLWLDSADRPAQARAEAKIKEKIGDIDVEISYEDG